MRHGMVNRKLGRTTGHRLAMFRNQLASLIDKERIITTLPKAKELRPQVERLVLSCLMEIDHAGEVVGYDIHEGLIRSEARMTYNEVQAILDGDQGMRRHAAPRPCVALGFGPGLVAEMALFR